MKNDKQAQVFHFDVFGKRQEKYHFLESNSIHSVDWKKLELKEPNYFFTIKDFVGEDKYVAGFKIDELFPIYNNGIETGKDSLFYFSNKNRLINDIEHIFENKDEAIKRYNIANTASFPFEDKFRNAKKDLNKIRKINYRPFDVVYCYYDENLQRRPAFSTMRNMFKSNLALLTPRQFSGDFKHVFISIFPTDCNLTGTAKKFGSAPIFPLYIYSNEKEQLSIEIKLQKIPNLNTSIVNQIAKKLNISFVPEKEPEGKVCYANNAEVRADFKTNFAPIDLLDYIYAVLHSPSYREKYKEFLKIDFPRVAYPKNTETFWQLVKLGGELRQLHLLESDKITDFKTTYPKDGNNVVSRKITKTSPGWEPINPENTIGRVWINDEQYFDNVPLLAWEFYIGGYQPVQKWLKDRQGRPLTFEDIIHYQKIIVALTETDRLMKEIDEVGVE